MIPPVLEITRIIDRSVVKFLLVGVANTLIGLTAIFLAKWLLGMADVPANVLGYGIGIGVSFYLNRSWTFRHGGPVWPALARFLLVTGVAYASNLVVMLAALNTWDEDGYFAQSLGVFPYVAISYLGSRYFAFSRRVVSSGDT